MPDPPPAKRTRASVPRPRSGCKTCKRRHVKCDETKPECLKCVQTGRKCDGYTEEVPKKSGARLSALASTLSISSYEIPFKIPGSQNDRRIFHYYCVHASNDLAGPSKSDFWTRLVLQCSQDEPVVRSALLALSYEHLDYVTRDAGQHRRSRRQGSNSLEGLQQHHKAVRQLRRYIGASKNPSIKAVLVCCILFFHFESSRGDAATALLHLRMGLAILRNQTGPDASPPGAATLLADTDMQELVRTLSRIDRHASMMDTARMPELDLITEDVRQGFTPCVGPPGSEFKTLREADAVLAKLQNWATRFVIGSLPLQQATPPPPIPPQVIAEKAELLAQCRRWLEALDAFESNLASPSSEEGDADAGLYMAELRLGIYTSLCHLHRSAPHNPGILHEPSAITQKILEQLSKLIPTLSMHSRPRVASIIGGSGVGSRGGSVSRAGSPSEEAGPGDEEDEDRAARTHLRPPVAAASRSPSPSPSPLPDSVPSNRSFCAQGTTIASLFVLAAKTTSRPFRDQLLPLLAHISQRREGPWSAATAYDVLVRLQDMADRSGGRPPRDLSQPPRFRSAFSFGDHSEASAEDGPRDESELSELGSAMEEGASEPSAASSPSPRLAALDSGNFALTQRARDYASHMLDGRPFCAVAACMRRGFHAERCIWCEDRHGQGLGLGLGLGQADAPSLEDVGARLIGGFSGFERFLQEKRG